MSSINVLLGKRDSVLALSVMNSLAQENDFNVVESRLNPDGSPSIDPGQPRPDVIIVETGMAPYRTVLSQINKHFPQTPIVVINSQEDLVMLFDYREVVIHEAAELVSAIRYLQTRKEGPWNGNVGG